jgi:hypothetical protein
MTPFRVVDLAGAGAGRSGTVTENAGAASVLVFVHQLERSMRCRARGG